MKPLTLVLMFVLISLTAAIFSPKKRSNGTKNAPSKDIRQKKLPSIRTTDHPNYDPMKDPYVYKILAKHHEDRRAKKLRKHKQKMKENIKSVLKQKNKQEQKLKKKQALTVFDDPGFQVNMTIRKALEAKRLRKLKHKMLEPVKAARRAKRKKQIIWNNTANNVIDMSKYKTKSLRVHKSDFNGREYYSPYLAKLTLHSMFSTM